MIGPFGPPILSGLPVVANNCMLGQKMTVCFILFILNGVILLAIQSNYYRINQIYITGCEISHHQTVNHTDLCVLAHRDRRGHRDDRDDCRHCDSLSQYLWVCGI